MAEGEKLCKDPGIQYPTFCIEPEGHEGCHTYGPLSVEEIPAVQELDWIIRLLLDDGCHIGFLNIKNPNPGCCPFHRAAATLVAIKEMMSGEAGSKHALDKVKDVK
ncbi:hypothetical protein LCGC14_1256020 [marine sediment metagenome]|uniref:Uncharacterized protein n=1 Tax=marine sediment metagenome TaxID=412755 RepID=A0A0F9P5H1_9ZZZZ